MDGREGLFEPLFSGRVVDKLWGNGIPEKLKSFENNDQFVSELIVSFVSGKFVKENVGLRKKLSEVLGGERGRVPFF